MTMTQATGRSSPAGRETPKERASVPGGCPLEGGRERERERVSTTHHRDPSCVIVHESNSTTKCLYTITLILITRVLIDNNTST